MSGCQRLRTRARRRRSQHHHVAAAVAELRPAAVSRRADACATRRPSRRASCQESGSVAPEVLRTCATRVAACNRHEHDSCARLWHEQCARRGFLQRSLREWPQDASRSARSEEWDAAGARRSALWRVMWSEVSYFESVALLNHNLRLGFCAWQKNF